MDISTSETTVTLSGASSIVIQNRSEKTVYAKTAQTVDLPLELKNGCVLKVAEDVILSTRLGTAQVSVTRVT